MDIFLDILTPYTMSHFAICFITTVYYSNAWCAISLYLHEANTWRKHTFTFLYVYQNGNRAMCARHAYRKHKSNVIVCLFCECFVHTTLVQFEFIQNVWLAHFSAFFSLSLLNFESANRSYIAYTNKLVNIRKQTIFTWFLCSRPNWVIIHIKESSFTF